MIKISIIVPFYNTIASSGNSSYLKNHIQSLINQTYQHIEIIYINNNSSDKTFEIIKEITSKDNRVCMIDEKSAGVAHARNAGIKIASGDYFTFVDSDDFVSIDYIQKAIDALKQQNYPDILIGEFTCQNTRTGETHHSLRKQAIKKYGNDISDIYAAMECVPNIFFRTNFIHQSNITQNANIKVGEDNLFNITAILAANKISFFDSDSYFYQVLEGSSSNQLSDKYLTFIEAYDIIFNMAYKKYGNLNACSVWYFLSKYKPFYELSANKLRFYRTFMAVLKKYNIKKRPKIRWYNKLKLLLSYIKREKND